MAPFQYPQFCALARAAEILGERWTLLIVRELLLGPKRFSDLRARLDGVSSSVLSERLAHLEGAGLVRRTFLEPPAASTVYELTDDGRALEGAVFELIRWGARFLLPPRPGERLEPDWLRLALTACARKSQAPPVSFEVRIPAGEKAVVIRVAGGPEGTRVTEDPSPAPAHVTITTDARSVLGLIGGIISPTDALRKGQIEAEGDLTALPLFPQLFDVTAGREGHMPATEEP
jgi:DNA-binding HxlR family transcriptional regulator